MIPQYLQTMMSSGDSAATQQANLPSMFGRAPQGGWAGANFGGSLPGVDATSKAPSYDLNTPAGLNNPMLQATLKTAGAGDLQTGVKAFLGNDYTPWNSTTAHGDTSGAEGMGGDSYRTTNSYNDPSPMLNLARSTGYDLSNFHGDPGQLYGGLNDYLKDYAGISGMSSGWSGQSDPRGASRTLYKNEGGILKPVTQPQNYHQAEYGGYLAQNPLLTQSLIAGASILSGGLAAGAAGGIGGAAANGVGAGSTWASMPAWGQGAVNGAINGGINSALTGGNGLQGIFSGALTGGLGPSTSGLTNVSSLPSWANSALGGAARGGLSAALGGRNAAQGAFNGAAGGLGGSYGGAAGSMAGRSLASLLYGR